VKWSLHEILILGIWTLCKETEARKYVIADNDKFYMDEKIENMIEEKYWKESKTRKQLWKKELWERTDEIQDSFKLIICFLYKERGILTTYQRMI
jgi:hypothetical protein